MKNRNNVDEIGEKKIFLCNYIKSKSDVTRLEQQLEEVRIQKISPINSYTGIPGSKRKSDLSDYLAKVEEIEQNIIHARYEQICYFQQVRTCIEEMDDVREKNLLTYRYIKNMKWEEIAETMIFSIQHVHKIHVKAIAHFNIL